MFVVDVGSGVVLMLLFAFAVAVGFAVVFVVFVANVACVLDRCW